MPWLLVGALVVLVAYMARKTPDVNPNGAPLAQSLGPDNSVPATGQGQVISPAMGGGSPLMSGANQLRLTTNFKVTAANLAKVALPPKTIGKSVTTSDADMGPTQADSSLPTQDVRPTVSMVIPGLRTNTSPLVRKL